jgi:hypothetical protein
MPSIPDTVALDRRAIKGGGLHEFVRRAWQIAEPGRIYQDNWHIREICTALETVSIGKNRRLKINVPPGTMKSLLVSVFWPAWVWGPLRRPEARWIYATYAQRLTEYHGRIFRNLVQSAWYQARWRVVLKGASVSEIENDSRGFRYATSVGGSVTGRHADFLVGDDLSKIQDAYTGGNALEDAWRFWDGVIVTRQTDPAKTARVLVGQRISTRDVFSHLDDADYVSLIYPMHGPANPPGPGDTRSEGELLWPERYPEAVVAELAKPLGPLGAAAQLEQNPVPEGGAIFNRDWLQWYDEPPAAGRITRWLSFWDFAFKSTSTADYYCGQVWVQTADDHYYLVDQVRGRRDFVALQREIVTVSLQWPQLIDLYFEDRGNGPAIKESLEQMIQPTRWEIFATLVLGFRQPLPKAPRIRFMPITPKETKLARFNAVLGSCWAPMRVHLPRSAPWIPGLVSELCKFTGAEHGGHDDQVDASTGALTQLSLAQVPSIDWSAAAKRFASALH